MANKRFWELVAAAALLVTVAVPVGCWAQLNQCRRNQQLIWEAERNRILYTAEAANPADLATSTGGWAGVKVPTHCPLCGCEYRMELTRDKQDRYSCTVMIECPGCTRLLQNPFMRRFGNPADYHRTISWVSCPTG